MASVKSMSIVSAILIVVFVGLILFGWYEMLSSPGQRNIGIFLAGIFILVWNITYTRGEWMPVIKQTILHTETGVVGVVKSVEHFEGGMTKMMVAVPKKYAEHAGIKEQPRSFVEKFGASMAGSVMVPVVGKTSDFEEVPSVYRETPEEAIMFRGGLNPDKKIPGRHEVMQKRLDQYESLFSQLVTTFEGATAQSAGLTQEENTNLVNAAIQGSVIVQNFQKAMSSRQMPRQPGGGGGLGE